MEPVHRAVAARRNDMHITIDRSGGFANIRRHTEIDTATLPPSEAAEIESLVEAARKSGSSVSSPMPDAFTYKVTIDGHQYVTMGAEGVWGSLIERLRS
jgi:hypothetical protein